MKLSQCKPSKEDANSFLSNYRENNKLLSHLRLTPSSKVDSRFVMSKTTELDTANRLSSKRKRVQQLSLVTELPQIETSVLSTSHLLSEPNFSNLGTASAQIRCTFTKSKSTGAGAWKPPYRRRERKLICSVSSYDVKNWNSGDQLISRKTRTSSSQIKQISSLSTVSLILFATILLLQVHPFSFKSFKENASEANKLHQVQVESLSTVIQPEYLPRKPRDQDQEATVSTLDETSATSLTSTHKQKEEEEGEDELSSTKDDDGDAEGCQGISADQSAEGKNISDSQRLVNLQTCIQRKMKLKLAETSREGLEMFQKLSLSGGCSASLMNLMFSLGQIKSFAFKFLDASAKIPSGVMYGLLSDFGDFDQCISIRSDREVPLEREVENGAYSGKYCLMNIVIKYHIKLSPNTSVPAGIYPDGVLWDDLVRNYWTSNSPKGFQVGMCFPSRCSMDDIDQLYRYVAESYNFQGQIISCQDGMDLRKQYTPDLLQTIIIYAVRILVIITILGSLIDRYHSKLTNAFSQSIKTKTLSSLANDLSATSLLNWSIWVAFIFELFSCFSLSRNWRYFTQANSEQTAQWDYFTSASSSNSKTERTISEEISARSSVIDHGSAHELVNSSGLLNEKEQYNSAESDKLDEITVNVRSSNDYVEFQKDGYNLAHLSGLKLIVIFWITMGYSFLYPSANNYQHYRSIINMNITRDSVWFATTNFTLGIDMLLYMAGLLFVQKISLMTSKTNRLGNRFSVYMKTDEGGGMISLVAKKILKFLLTYLTVIGLAIIIPLMGEGPMWPEIVSKKIGATCRQNWWVNLLFINNFSRESEICLPSSWFLSVLVQLFLIGSFIIVLERKHSRFASWAALITLLVASCAYSFTYSYLLNIRAPVIKMDESFVLEMDDNIWRFYINTLNNLGPFLIGMAGGFILINARQLKQVNAEKTSLAPSSGRSSTKRVSITFAWLNQVSKTVIITIIAISVLSSVFYNDYSPIWSSIYWSSHRIGWALVTGYLVHNCATGKWKLLHDMLSLSTLSPMSKLIFTSYLVYPIFTYMHSGLVRDGLHVSIYNMLTIYTARLVMTFITSLFIHLLVELPLHRIGDLCLSKWSKRREDLSRNNKSAKVHPLLALAPSLELSGKQSINQEQSYVEVQDVVVEKGIKKISGTGDSNPYQ